MNFTKIFVVYLLLVNIFALGQMWFDKKRSLSRGWRIPENRLFLTALVGGSVGSIAGMYSFRHKTQHWLFAIGMPIIFVVQFIFAIYLIN